MVDLRRTGEELGYSRSSESFFLFGVWDEESKRDEMLPEEKKVVEIEHNLKEKNKNI